MKKVLPAAFAVAMALPMTKAAWNRPVTSTLSLLTKPVPAQTQVLVFSCYRKPGSTFRKPSFQNLPGADGKIG